MPAKAVPGAFSLASSLQWPPATPGGIVYALLTPNRVEGFMDDPSKDNQPPTFLQMLQSVLAAAFGVQSGKNRARDFSHGKPSHFIVLGILFTTLFVLVLLGIANLAMHLAGV